MKKYLALKVFYITIRKYKASVAFAVRGNQFCLLPCIRWKGILMTDGITEGHAIHIMFLIFVIGFNWKRVYI